MTDLYKMAREVLADEYESRGYSVAAGMVRSGDADAASALAAIRAALLTAPPGYVLVPVDLIDAFPEINPSNYDHDQACNLNAWGCQIVKAAAPEVT